jgi:hypothetical protein
MMRVGIEVGQERVHVVLTDRARIVWHGATPVALLESVADAVERVLSDVPLSGRARHSARVHLAAGPSWVQTKTLTGLPTIPKARHLSRLVRENAPSFFLRGRGPIVLGAVDHRPDGTTWAAAFDESVLHHIIEGVKRSGMRFEIAVPSVSAVASLIADGSFSWVDGAARTHVTARNGTIERLRVSGDSNPTPAIPAALTPAGARAWSYAAAYAATLTSRRAVFVWRVEPDARRVARRRTAVNVLAVSLVVMATLAVTLAPGFRATRFIARHAGELEAERVTRAEISRTDGELRRVSTLLDAAERFRA